MVTHVTERTFEEDVLTATRPVVVDFWADWCAPCKMIAPIFDAVAKEYEGQVDFVKLDVDANPDAAKRYGVQGIPTMLFFKNGEPVARVVGMVSKGKLSKQVDAILH